MDRNKQLEVFVAETKNVRRLGAARTQVRRTIQNAMRRGDGPSEEAHTVVLALLYCAWLEALFVKILHTPHGFELSELQEIRSTHEHTGIHSAWVKSIELGLKRVAAGPRGGDIPNIRQRLLKLVAEYVKEPAELRNKIAHGQWAVALNSRLSAVQSETTMRLQQLDIVVLDRWFEIAEHIADIVEVLVESPERHFRGAYWTRLTSLEERIRQMSGWTRESRIVALRKKPIPPPA